MSHKTPKRVDTWKKGGDQAADDVDPAVALAVEMTEHRQQLREQLLEQQEREKERLARLKEGEEEASAGDAQQKQTRTLN